MVQSILVACVDETGQDSSSIKNHKLYCGIHKYSYKIIPSISYIYDLLDEYSCICIINKYLIFLNLNRKIESFLNNNYAYFPLEKQSPTLSIKYDQLCSDSWIIKNSSWSKQFISEWILSKNNIQDFINEHVDIDSCEGIQNIEILPNEYRIYYGLLAKNKKLGRECLLLNLSELIIDDIEKFVELYNKKLGII